MTLPFPTRRAVLAGLAASLLVPMAAPAQTALSAADQADVRRAEAYLNGIRTLQARFLQVADSGDQAQGGFFLSRPGKMRLEYDKPNPNLLVANGAYLIHYDAAINSASYLPLSSSPAGILTRERIALSGDLTVTRVERAAGVLRITVVRAEDPNAGRITLIFADQPLKLTQWQVVDPQGRVANITLSDMRTDVALDPKLFTFVDPAFRTERQTN